MKMRLFKRCVCTLLVVFLCVSMVLPVAYATNEEVSSGEVSDHTAAEETVAEETSPEEVVPADPSEEQITDDAEDEVIETTAEDVDADDAPAADDPTATAVIDDETPAEIIENDPETSVDDPTVSSVEPIAPKVAKKDTKDLASTGDSAALEFHVGGGRLYKSDMQSLFGESSGYFGIAKAASPNDIHYFSTNTILTSYQVESGSYIAYRTTSATGSLIKTPVWSAAATIDLTVRFYYTASFSVEGHEDGSLLLNGNETSGTDIELYTDTEYTVTAKEIAEYVYTINGAQDGVAFTPTADMTITAVYMKNEFATVTLVENEGGSTKIKSGDKDITDKVQAGESFTVVPTPDSAHNYYLESVVVKKNGEEVEGPEYGPVADGEEYTVTVTYAQATLTLSDCEVNIFDIQNGYYDALEQAILSNASLIPEEFLDEAAFSVQYDAGILLANYQPLSFGGNILTHTFGEGSVVGSVTIGNTEDIRVTCVIASQNLTLTADAVATVADLRIPTAISGSAVTITYGDDLKEALLPNITIIGDDGQNVTFTAEDITIDPEQPDVKLLQNQDITVKFGGNDQYAASEGTISVYVRQADSSLDVKNETISYGETPALQIDTEPADLDIIRLIAGIDGDATGFISIDIPNSVKERMKIKVGGFTIFDFYDFLSNQIGDGVSLSQLQGIISSVNDIAQNELVASGIEAAGFNVEVLQTILGAISDLPTIDLNVKISLGKAPTNAGVYLVTAVSADLNYRLAADVGYLVILPQTSTEENSVELRFINDIPGALNVMSYNDAQTFSFGGELYVNDEQIDSSHVYTLYAGTSYAGQAAVQSNEPIREPGVYTETVYVLGGNYLAMPIIRTYTVQRKPVALKMDNETVVYDKTGHALTAYADDGTDLKNNVSYLYTGFGYFSNIPPVNAGVYTVTASYSGDAEHLPAIVSAALTIKEAEATITVTCKDEVTYGDISDDDITALDLSYEVSGVIEGDDLGGILTLINKTEKFPHVGTYEAAASFRQTNFNYNVTIVKKNFMIVPRPVTLTIDTVSKKYGDLDPKLTYQIKNLAFEDELDVTLTRAEGEDVGEYPITATVAENPDYAITIVGEYKAPAVQEENPMNGDNNSGLAPTGADSDDVDYGLFKITAREITIIIDDASKTAGEEDPEFSCRITDGENELTPEMIGLTITRTAGEKPGKYRISYSFTNNNYTVNESKSSDAVFTIYEAPTEQPTYEPTDPTDAPQPATGGEPKEEGSKATVEQKPASPQTGSLNTALAFLIVIFLSLTIVLVIRRKQRVTSRNRRFM